MDIFRFQELYQDVPEFVGEDEGDDKPTYDPVWLVGFFAVVSSPSLGLCHATFLGYVLMWCLLLVIDVRSPHLSIPPRFS